mmetsp:Transcript_25962/g.53952  ORF Transcript_25962/g.53952 Transcript_25962/m.53952 type:complete len:166 (-) Transcript_25962:486-983(-)
MTTMFLRAALQLTYISCILCFTIPQPCSNLVNKVHGYAVSNRALSSCKKAGVQTRLTYKMAAVDVTDTTFKREVLESTVLTVVSFWAPWCGPCRMIKPVLDEIESECRGEIKIALINTDENQQTAVDFGIRSIPTLILFRNGIKLDTIIGAVPKATLEAKLAQNF